MTVDGESDDITPRRIPVFVRADGSAPRVLVVDDEQDLTSALVSAFSFDGWYARAALDGASAVRAAREFLPDLVVLDVMLPDIDGLEVLRRLRAAAEHVCVLFLTARDAVPDRVSGIVAGADDYVTKPFNLEEVLARSRGLVRRPAGHRVQYAQRHRRVRHRRPLGRRHHRAT